MEKVTAEGFIKNLTSKFLKKEFGNIRKGDIFNA